MDSLQQNHAGAAQEPDTSRLWNETEAARYLCVSIEFLQVDRIKSKRIPFIKIGRAVRYDPADVIKYKNSCRIGTVSGA